MRNRVMLITVVVTVLMGLAVTALSDEGDATSERGADTVRLTAADDGSAVVLAEGDTLIVRLEGNPTTGYSWEIDELDQTVLRLQGEPGYEAESDLIGSGGMFTFTFEAAGEGETDLVLVYHRPWEENDPIETFSVMVDVD